MTAAQTASQRGKANRNRGHNAERAVAKYLRDNGFPHAERAVRAGFATASRTVADPGDIRGCLGVVVSVKDAATERLDQWMAELDAMDDREVPMGDAPARLLVHKRRGHADPGRWWCWMRASTFAAELDNAETSFVFPVRMEFGDAVMVLRAAGYGQAIEVPA
jgi:hypothetical protein